MKEKSNSITGHQVVVVGVNYTSTPLWVREKLSIPRSQISNALESLRSYVSKGVILATCNRTEIYTTDDHSDHAERAIRRFLADWSSIPEEDLTPHFYHSRNYTAMRHLSRTAAGLYSMIIGEYEILGQVKQALDSAEKCGMTNLPLRHLFQHAVRTGRKVRTETQISKNALSISSVAVDLATNAIGDIRNSRVLLIGAGEAGKLVAKALLQRGVTKITVASRPSNRAQNLASMLNADCIGVEEIYPMMSASDIVISCTGSPHYIIHQAKVEEMMRSRDGRPLIIVDIAVPRDVEADVKQINGVFAYDIDDLDKVSEMNRKERENEVEKAMQIVDDEMEELTLWWRSLEVKPTIKALKHKAETIRQHQVQLGLKKLPSLSLEDQEAIDTMTKSMVKKLLHDPIKHLTENDSQNGDLSRVIAEIFDLDERGSN